MALEQGALAQLFRDGEGLVEVVDPGDRAECGDPADRRHPLRQVVAADLGVAPGGLHPPGEGEEQAGPTTAGGAFDRDERAGRRVDADSLEGPAARALESEVLGLDGRAVRAVHAVPFFLN